MYKAQLIQKKKRQALRRLSQSGKKTASPTSPGVVGKRNLFALKRGSKVRSGSNPFLKAAGPSKPPPLPLPSSQENPFLAAKHGTSLSGPSSDGRPKLPTYAQIVGQKNGSTSIPVSDKTSSNPFLRQPSGLQLPQHHPPQGPTSPLSTQTSITSQNPVMSQGPMSSRSPLSSQTSITSQNSVMSQGPMSSRSPLSSQTSSQATLPLSSGIGPIPQIPLNTGGLFAPFGLSQHPTSTLPHPHARHPTSTLPPPYARHPPHAPALDQQPPPLGTGYDPRAVAQALPLADNTALHVKGIPVELNNPDFMRKHFSRFGKITMLRCNPNKLYATVAFATREEATKAKGEGKILLPNHNPVKLFWSTRPSSAMTHQAVPPRLSPQGSLARSRVFKDPRLTWRPAQVPRQEAATAPGLRQATGLGEEDGSGGVQQETIGGQGGVQQETIGGQGGVQQETIGGREGFRQETIGGWEGVQQETIGGREGFQQETIGGREGFQQETIGSQGGVQQETIGGWEGFRQETIGGWEGFQQETIGGREGFQQETIGGREGFQQETIGGRGGFQQETIGGWEGFSDFQKAETIPVIPQQQLLPTFSPPTRKPLQFDPIPEEQEGMFDLDDEEEEPEGARSPLKVSRADEERSVWERLGGKVDGSRGDVGGGERRVAIITRQMRRKAKDDDEEWLPSEVVGEEEGEDEGVFEDTDPVLTEGISQQTEEEMDTIARMAKHPYFLRSLMKPEAFGFVGQNAPTQAPAPTYQIPTLLLPPPPPPKGNTADDLYEALDTRDQEIRRGVVKQTSLTEAKAITGTCPDMCPEKERYMRQARRRFSIFEMRADSQPGNPIVDHSRAIKEYSGSAADKEEPLPHELRPLGVLQMTMDYLVTMVMDAGEGRWSEWYNFVWNRTRAIRKDITLQHLCTPECAELAEKCARFHILCAHFLCEEDLSVFDPKMNDENLTKCLQSIKEFYRDLRIQKGIHCSKEAEFCCYDILLHLNDGNVLNLVQLYSDHVRHAHEVRFAVDVALAVDSNNFVKFFKLLRSATFLQACIMHRYINQVRTKGLRVLNNAHSVSKRDVNFPLNDLARMLTFQNEAEGSEFSKHYGLTVGRKYVHFARGSVIQPDQPLPIARCPRLVESKNDKCLGEVVHGGPLPPPPAIPPPYCSFSQPQVQPQVAGPPLAREPTPPPAYTEEGLVVMATSLEASVVYEEVTDVVMECLSEVERVELVKTVSATILEDLIGQETYSMCRELAQTAFSEATRHQEFELEQERLRQVSMEAILSEVLAEVVTSEVHAVAQQTLRERMIATQALTAAISSVGATLVEECVCEVVRDVCEEVVKRERRERLEELKRQFLNRQMRKCWGKWRHKVKVRQHVRQCASDMPPLPPLVPLPWQLHTLVPVEKRRRLECPLDPDSLKNMDDSLSDTLQGSRLELEERRQAFIAPIPLPHLLQDALLASRTPTLRHSTPPPTLTPDISWMAILVHPDEQELSRHDNEILNWIKGKLKFQPLQSQLSTHTEKLSISSGPIQSRGAAITRKLQIAVKSVSSLCSRAAMADELVGTSAILVYIPTPQEGESPEALYCYVHRLVSLVTRNIPSCPQIPLLVVASVEMEQEFLAHWIKLQMVMKSHQPLISDVHFMTINLSSDTVEYPTHPEEKLCAGLQWLAEHSPSQPSITHIPLKDFVEQGLLEHFVSLVVADSERRQKAGLPSQPPSVLVGLHNAVVDHLSHLASHPDLSDISWPIADFAPAKFSRSGLPPSHWNSTEYFTSVREHLAELRLPNPRRLLDNEYDWSTMSSYCLEYVASIDRDEQSIIPLLSRVKSLLHRHSKVHPGHMTIPWDQVILTCEEHVMNKVTSDLWVARCHGKEREFAVPHVWLCAQAETSLARAAEITRQPREKKRSDVRRRSDPYLPSPQSTRKEIRVDISPMPREVRERRSRLENSLRREKALSQSFEVQLQQWISSENSPPSQPRGSPASEDLEPSERTWEGSLEDGLKLLKMKIRTARWQDTVDSVQFQTITNHSPS